jgi:protein TonB
MRSIRVRRWASVIGVALATCLPPPSAAVGCEEYEVGGIRLGANGREVRKAMDGPGEQIERFVLEGSGYVTERFLRSPSKLEVTYEETEDSDLRSARVVRLEFVLERGSERGALDRLGDPDRGSENLNRNEVSGPVVWLDPSCGVVVTADQQSKDWWEGGSTRTELEYQAWTLARARRGTPGALAIAEWEEAPAESWQAVVSLVPATGIPENSGEVPSTTVEGSGVLQAPVRLEDSWVAPRYPRFPKGPKVDALVVLDVTVLADGTTGDIEVQSTSHPGRGFETAAIDAVRKWLYDPAKLDGVPVEAKITVEVHFR